MSEQLPREENKASDKVSVSSTETLSNSRNLSESREDLNKKAKDKEKAEKLRAGLIHSEGKKNGKANGEEHNNHAHGEEEKQSAPRRFYNTLTGTTAQSIGFGFLWGLGVAIIEGWKKGFGGGGGGGGHKKSSGGHGGGGHGGGHH